MIEEQANPGTMIAYWPIGGGLLHPEGSQGIVKYVSSIGDDAPMAMVHWQAFPVAQLVPLCDLQVITPREAGVHGE